MMLKKLLFFVLEKNKVYRLAYFTRNNYKLLCRISIWLQRSWSLFERKLLLIATDYNKQSRLRRVK